MTHHDQIRIPYHDHRNPQPSNLVDRNGMWPTKIHNLIIDSAFPDLSPAQRQVLKDVSREQDSILRGGQSNSLSFQHAMRRPGESPEEAESDFDYFVQLHESQALKIQIQFWLAGNHGYSDKALAEFAAALHAILDSTSPAHDGFQLWDWRNPRLAWHHFQMEQSISPQQLQTAVSAARNAFSATFRAPEEPDEFDLLNLLLQPQPYVTHKICPVNSDSSCE